MVASKWKPPVRSNIDWSKAPEGATHFYYPFYYRTNRDGELEYNSLEGWCSSAYKSIAEIDGVAVSRHTAKQPEQPNKYSRAVKGVSVDVYDILKAWNVTNPALQHLIKKALQCGERGHKSRVEDLDDILASAKRAKELGVMSDKCTVDGIHFTPCDMLGRSLSYGNPTSRSKGVFIPERVNIGTGDRSYDILQVHSGDFVGNGAAAHYCPFCGVKLTTWENG